MDGRADKEARQQAVPEADKQLDAAMPASFNAMIGRRDISSRSSTSLQDPLNRRCAAEGCHSDQARASAQNAHVQSPGAHNNANAVGVHSHARASNAHVHAKFTRMQCA